MKSLVLADLIYLAMVMAREYRCSLAVIPFNLKKIHANTHACIGTERLRMSHRVKPKILYHRSVFAVIVVIAPRVASDTDTIFDARFSILDTRIIKRVSALFYHPDSGTAEA